MNATEAKKRKIIDLDEHTFRVLSIDAAAKGTNLKALIEESLREMAEDLEDTNLYAYFLKNDPEGQVYLDPKEQAAFEQEMGL